MTMKGPSLIQGIILFFIKTNFQPCNSKIDILSLDAGIPNKGFGISSEYFYEGFSVSDNNIAIYRNITDVLNIALDGKRTLIPQDRTIFIWVQNEPHLHQVMTSINAYSQHSNWRLTYILRLPRDLTYQKILLLPKIYTKIDIASRVFLEFVGNELFEIYFIKERVFLKQLRHFFRTPAGLNLRESDLYRRKDFDAVVINGVTQDDKELDLIATFENSTTPKFSSGLSVSYFELMAAGLNFSIGAVRGTGWISLGEDGHLLGMAEQLIAGEADILIAHSELLPYRLRGLKFLHPYYRGRVRAFFKQPGLSKIRNIFFQPLQTSVWISLGVLWLLLVIALRSAFTLKRKVLGATRRKFGRKCSDLNLIEEDSETEVIREKNMNMDRIFAKDAFLWAISTACGQGWHILPHSGSMKLIVLSGLTTYIFSYTAYSAAIVTSLSVFLIPIKSWADLSGWSGYTLYGDVLFQSSAQFANSTKTSGSNTKHVMNVTEALNRFQRNEPIALISVYDQFYQIAGKANYSHDFLCRSVSKVSVAGHVVKGGMILRQDSPFGKYFNYVTIRIQERGLDARLSRHYSNKWSPGCLEQGTGGQRREKYILEINDVFTAFAILLVGFISSGWIVLIERGKLVRCTLSRQETHHVTNVRNIFYYWEWFWGVGTKLWKKFKIRLKLRQSWTTSKSLIK